MNVQRGKLVSGGRLQVPADIRRALGLSDGDPVTLRIVDGALQVRPLRDAIARVQARMREHLPPGGPSRVDEFIADRRAEAAKE
jgi:antitoxin PrlF